MLDDLAFLVIDLHQLAVHPALHGDGMERGDGAEPDEVDADVPLLGRGGGDLDRGRLRPCPGGRALGRLPHSADDDNQDDRQQDHGDQEPPASDERPPGRLLRYFIFPIVLRERHGV